MSLVELTHWHRLRIAGRDRRAHYAQALVAIEHDYLLSLIALHHVMAVTEENKSILHQPTQEIADFDQFAVAGRLLADLQGARLHRREIGGSCNHLGENSPQI